jgi:hypothetical protein
MFDQFRENKDGMLTLVREIPGMSAIGKKQSRAYLKNFFKIIESSKRRQKDIIDACYPWPPSPVDHTTPPDVS